VIETTSNRSDVDALALIIKPDLLLYDIHLSTNGRAGLIDFKILKEQLPEQKILVVGFLETTDHLEEDILSLGFDGYFSKSETRQEFIQKIILLFR
jgi:DNA-binding NarL/FixJ family response regulator